MKASQDNPDANQLGVGVNEEQVMEAVRKSGFPLQTLIANYLRTDFVVQEEWSYMDSDTGTQRTLDIVASRRIREFGDKNQPFVRPTLNFLIECKQSDLPFIFFMTATRPWLRNFPFFAGLGKESVVVKTDDDRSTWSEGILRALSLEEDPFVSNAVDCCMSLSKCVRKGKGELELSGPDAFQSIVLPLVKSLRYFKRQEAPPATARYFDLHIPLAVAVIDAPMIAAKIDNNQSSLILTPWVRVARYEAVEAESWLDRTEIFGIDVVHKSFFETYTQRHAIPFALKLAPLAVKHHVEIATGKGFIKGMGADSHSNIEGRLKPR
ncbi:hypothetical protein C2U70_25070 [Bradyrhizobium guangdongense]|uniref:hypothetical protein n=1 Tax=Bradyrhizobium guangdongense TaxID=1325090 RepID=UPI0011278D78|nr:hypothetical protein [Bradyrhizobium guangdongense]TPQ31063.1 hypothetical protein C2U70_25070 [Bradyrhizobium guangdongense]